MQSENTGSISKVTTNAFGATYQCQSWLRNNNYHRIQDKEGTFWTLKVISKLGPNPEDTHGGIWDIKVQVSSVLDRDILLNSEILDPDKDARLANIIGSEKIPIEFKRPGTQTRSKEASRRFIADEVEKLRELLNSSDLSDIKRRLIGEWVDDRCKFK